MEGTEQPPYELRDMTEADWEAYCEANEPPAGEDDEGFMGSNYGGALW